MLLSDSTLRLGAATPSKAYLGATQVWPPAPTEPEGFQLTEIPDLGMWWDASTLTAADGAALGTFPDRSGNGRSGSGSPIVRTNGLGGQRVVEFDGTQTLTTTYSPVAGAGGRTFVVVLTGVTNHSTGSLEHIYQYGNNASSQAYGLTTRTQSVAKFGAHYWVGLMTNGPAISTAPMILIHTYDGTTDRLYSGGTQIGSATIALNTVTTYPLTVGGRIFGAERAAFRLAELGVWPRALTSTERATLVSELSSKWSLAA